MTSFSGGDPGGSGSARLPSFLDSRNEFGQLIVLQMKSRNKKGLPKKPFMIGESIENAVGRIESAKSEAQGATYILRVRNPAQAEKLLAMKTLADKIKSEVTYHPFLNTCKCVISSYDLLEEKEEEIQDKLSCQGVTHVKRITRYQNGDRSNTPALILTFGKTTYPEHVKVGVLRVTTRPYYPNPLLCYNCFEYGHPKLRCPLQKRCYNCSGNHVVESCEENAHCLNCEQDHRPNNRKCPKYQKEIEIIKAKIDFNLSYVEAKKRVECANASYAQVTAQTRIDAVKNAALLETNKKKDEQITKLIESLNEKNKQIEKLEQMVYNLQKHIIRISPKNEKESESKVQNTQKSKPNRKSKLNRQDTDTEKRQIDNSPISRSPPSKRIIFDQNSTEIDFEIRDQQELEEEEVVFLSENELEDVSDDQPNQLYHK